MPLDRLGLTGAQIRGDYTRGGPQVIDPTTHDPRPISGLHPSDWDFHFSQPVGRVIYGVDLYGGWQQRNYRFNEIEIDKLRDLCHAFLGVEAEPRLELAHRARQRHRSWLQAHV